MPYLALDLSNLLLVVPELGLRHHRLITFVPPNSAFQSIQTTAATAAACMPIRATAKPHPSLSAAMEGREAFAAAAHAFVARARELGDAWRWVPAPVRPASQQRPCACTGLSANQIRWGL